MKKIGVIALVTCLVMAEMPPAFADGMFSAANEPSAKEPGPASNRRTEIRDDAFHAQSAQEPRTHVRQLNLRHPWSNLTIPTSTPLAKGGHHVQSVLGPKKTKAKKKGPSPVMEYDDDITNTTESNSSKTQKGKSKKKKLAEAKTTSHKLKLQKPSPSPSLSPAIGLSGPTSAPQRAGTPSHPTSPTVALPSVAQNITSTTGIPTLSLNVTMNTTIPTFSSNNTMNTSTPTLSPFSNSSGTPVAMQLGTKPPTTQNLPSGSPVGVQVGLPTLPSASSTPFQAPTATPTQASVNSTITANFTAIGNSTLSPRAGAPSASPRPGQMPSSKPVLNIVSAPKDAFLKSVEANPIFLNVTGAFDPGTQKQQFAEVLRTSFESYSQVNVGNILNAFDMTVMFMDDLTQHVVATGTNESLNTAWCEVNVTFNVGSNTETGLDSLTTEKGSMLVLKFFLASRKTQLIVDLNNTGIPVNDIEAFYALPDDIKAILDADLMKVQAGLAGATTAGNGDSSTGSQSNTVLIAAVASGGVIFVALGVVLLSHRHKNRVGMEAYGKESLTGDSSSYSDSSDAHAVKFVTGENGTEVKPAALHVRMQRERERQEKAVSANSTVSSYRTSETPTGNMTTGYANKGNGGTLSYSSGGEVHERALARLEDGPNLIASGALTCLDGEESVGALNEAYPEFDLYQMANSSPPPSPVWSVGNFSNTTPYSAEEDYIAARRRWHDEANDLELIALPDHGDSSDPESASHSHSDASSKIEKV